jgi:cytidylate kinase-like protein
MQQAPVDMVTVSREYGAGGSEFARALGSRLGWYVFDQDLIARVAERLHLKTGIVEQRDEQPPGWFARIAATLLIAPPESPLLLETSGLLTPDSIAEAAHAAIVEAAQKLPVIIVGHGAQYIFRDRPGTLQVRLTAPVESRLPRIRARDGGTDRDAADRARHMDAQRQGYVQRYYHHNWSDPHLFDAQFNTGRTTIAEAVSAVASLVEARGAAHVAHTG